MPEQSTRARTPSRRAQEALDASTLQTPPYTRGSARLASLSIYKQAAAASRAKRGATAVVVATPMLVPPSTQERCPTLQSLSPPLDSNSPRLSIESLVVVVVVAMSAAPVAPVETSDDSSEEVLEEDKIVALDLDVRIKISLDNKLNVTLMQRLQ